MKCNAGRPIGARIREVLSIVEAMGSATVIQVRPRLSGGVEHSNAAKYCSRAVGLGLMTVDRDKKPMVFTPVDGWRQLIEEREAAEPVAEEPRPTGEETVAIARRTQPNSVFALAAMNFN
jgi:hypothetical protein